MFGLGVRRDSLLHESLDVLEVACHPLLEVLLRIPDVDLICHVASNFVNDYRYSTHSSILALASTSGISAVAISDFEIHRFDSFGQFF